MSEANQKKKRSVILLIACIIATAVYIYLFTYMGGSIDKLDSMSSTEQLGTEIAMSIASPSLIVAGIGTILAWIGWLFKIRGFALAAGILFAVAMILLPSWFMFHILQMILCFVAFAKMK